MSANGNAGFIGAFTSITDGLGNENLSLSPPMVGLFGINRPNLPGWLLGSPAAVSTHPDNQHLNRYSNIVAYDAHRVKVAQYPENYHCDYINASWIASQRQSTLDYIAAQGPVPASLFS